MAANILKSGASVMIYDTSLESPQVKSLIALGATVASSPAALAAQVSTAIITMLPGNLSM